MVLLLSWLLGVIKVWLLFKVVVFGFCNVIKGLKKLFVIEFNGIVGVKINGEIKFVILVYFLWLIWLLLFVFNGWVVFVI